MNGLATGQDEATLPAGNPAEFEDLEASLKEKLPRYSVVYNGKSVDVYADVRMSQVYCIAQDYFQRSQETYGKSSEDETSNVAVESMDVYPISDLKERSQSSQRPKSIFREYDEDNVSSMSANNLGDTFPGMYMSKTIGSEGGWISIQGARLTIPVGALSVSTKIYLGVVWKSGGCPPLTKQQALLSSVVACEPPGLEFHHPVNLEIQHCAQRPKEWELCIMRSNTSVLEGTYRFQSSLGKTLLTN